MQLVAVTKEPLCLALIANPGLPVQRAAAGLPEEGIIEALQLAALRRRWDPITEIKNPTEATQLYVLGNRQLDKGTRDAMLERSSPAVQKAFAMVTQALGVGPYTAGFADLLNKAYAGIKRTDFPGVSLTTTGT